MKTYEVSIKAYLTVLVEANTEDESRELADDFVALGDLELDSILSKEINNSKVASMKRHFKTLRLP